MHPALVVSGITLGILTLFGIQFAIPYFLGPWGLVVVGVLDLLLFLELRRRRSRRTRPRKSGRIVFGTVDRRYVSHAKRPLEAELVATFAFAVFLVAIYALGVGIRFESLAVSPNLDLYIAGSILTTLAWVILRRWSSTERALESESEKYDTTEDH